VRYLPFNYLRFSILSKYFSICKLEDKIENGRFRKWKIQSGQSLFEVVVALAISALVIVTLVSLATNSIRTSIYSKNNSLATTYANQAIEWLRGQRDSNPTTFKTKATALTTSPGGCFNTLPTALTGWPTTVPTNCPTPTTIAGTSLVRRIKFTITTTPAPAKTLVQADVTVSWTDSQGKHTVTSATVFSDWRQR